MLCWQECSTQNNSSLVSAHRCDLRGIFCKGWLQLLLTQQLAANQDTQQQTPALQLQWLGAGWLLCYSLYCCVGLPAQPNALEGPADLWCTAGRRDCTTREEGSFVGRMGTDTGAQTRNERLMSVSPSHCFHWRMECFADQGSVHTAAAL